MTSTDKRHQILNNGFGSLIVTLCLPAIVGMVVIALYSFMDSVYAGLMIGKHAMAAIGVAYPFTLINNSISVLFGMGGASLLSRAIGANDETTKHALLPGVSMFVIISSAVTTVLGGLFSGTLIGFTGAQGDLFVQATAYLRLIFLGSLFINLTQALNMLMRAEGRMIRAMSIMGLGALINIALDPLFIALWPHLGVRAVAIATLISQVVQCVLTLVYFTKQSPDIRWSRPHFVPGLASAIIPVGLSGMAMQMATMIQQIVLFRVAAEQGGDRFQIILSALLRIQMFAFIPLWGASQGFQPFVGTHFGARSYRRLLQGRRVFLLFAFALSLLFFLPMEIIPQSVLSLFITDTALRAMAITPARIFFSTFFLYGFMALLGIYFQAIGDAKTAGIVVIGRNLVLFLPLVFLLPALLGPGAIWWSYALCDIAMMTYAFIKYASHGRSMAHALATDASLRDATGHA